MKNYILMLVIAAFAVVATGCNTAKGFGEDMENAGEKIQEETR